MLALFLMLLFAPSVYAGTTISIPGDFVSEIAKIINYKANLNFIERVILNQVIKNSSINGLKLKRCTAENLIKYFNQDELFKKIGSNKLVEPYSGATLEFNTDGKCKKQGKCYIVVDLNGDLGPNEIWTSYMEPKDRLIFEIQKNKKELSIKIPELKD